MVVCKLQERTAVEVSRTRINFLLTNIKKKQRKKIKIKDCKKLTTCESKNLTHDKNDERPTVISIVHVITATRILPPERISSGKK